MLGFVEQKRLKKKSCRFSNFLLWLQSVQIPPHLRGQRYNKKLKTESGKRKTFSFSVFAWSGKTELTTNRGQRLLADYAEVRRRKSLRSRIKAENGKLSAHSLNSLNSLNSLKKSAP